MTILMARFFRDEAGATSIEYALIGGVVSIVITGGATLIGTKLSGFFNKVQGNLN